MLDRPTIRPFRHEDEGAVIDLWRVCGLVVPWNDPAKDIRRKLKIQGHLLLVAEAEGRVVGVVMAGYEGHRGWVNYMAVDPARRREGIGQALMVAAEEGLRELGCPKVCLQVRYSNRAVVAFYERLGYEDNEVASFGKCLEIDGPRPAPEPRGPELDTVIIHSRNPSELAAFYEAVFGPLEWERHPGHLGCRLGAFWFGIDEWAPALEPGGAGQATDLDSACVEAPVASFWITVDDLDGAWARALAAGARVRRAPATAPWGARLASGWDPQGNLFGLRQR